MTDQTDPLAALRGRGPFEVKHFDGLSYVSDGSAMMLTDEMVKDALNLALTADEALAAKDAEIAAESNRADLHADINRRTAVALGKPTSGEGSSWHDIPEQVAALKVRLDEPCETCTLYEEFAALQARVRRLEEALRPLVKVALLVAANETMKE